VGWATGAQALRCSLAFFACSPKQSLVLHQCLSGIRAKKWQRFCSPPALCMWGVVRHGSLARCYSGQVMLEASSPNVLWSHFLFFPRLCLFLVDVTDPPPRPDLSLLLSWGRLSTRADVPATLAAACTLVTGPSKTGVRPEKVWKKTGPDKVVQGVEKLNQFEDQVPSQSNSPDEMFVPHALPRHIADAVASFLACFALSWVSCQA
jgi:hypothetical protein